MTSAQPVQRQRVQIFQQEIDLAKLGAQGNSEFVHCGILSVGSHTSTVAETGRRRELPAGGSGLGCSYAEAAFFDRAPVAHCAAWDEVQRLSRLDRQGRALARSFARQRPQPHAMRRGAA